MNSILYVEDDREWAKFITDVLDKEGHIVTHFSDGWEALDEIDTNPYDVIVTDWELGFNQPDGLRVLKQAKFMQPEALTIVFSGLDRTPECRTAGVQPDHMLIKSDIDKLISVLGDYRAYRS